MMNDRAGLHQVSRMARPLATEQVTCDLLVIGSGSPPLAPGDQFKTPIAHATVPVVMPGLSHDDAPYPLLSTEEYVVWDLSRNVGQP